MIPGEKMVNKITTMSVLGCCASRNIFNVKLGNEYKVSGYVFNNNPFLINQSVSNKYDIPDADIVKLPISELKHAHPRESLKSLINCNAREILLQKKGEWIIVDTHYSTHDAYKLKYPNGEEILLQSNYAKYINILIKNCDALKDFSIEHLSTQIDIDDYIDELCEFLRKNWGRNIILLNTKPSFNRVIGPELSANEYLSVIKNELKNYEYSQKILSRLDCHYIEIPFPIARDASSSVHYTSEVQEYLKLKVDIIINYGNTSPRKYINAINKLDAEYGQKIRRILTHYLDGSVSAGYMGRAYRDGKGVEKDLNKAAEWMRKASNAGVGWAKNELFDILWRIGTPEAHEEMISVAAAFAELGDGNAMGRLGRAYRDGKGVEKDLNKAAEWMRKASNAGVGWAKNELFDILWRIGTPEGFAEMKTVAEAGAIEGDAPSMGRLGRMYRDGKGVEKDLKIAEEWMRKAMDKAWWWGVDLSDLLLNNPDKECHKDAFEICSKIADENADGKAMGYLGRMYRDGKGVEKDLNKAAEWMRKASDAGVGWAKNELFDILWRIGTPEAHEEMISVATAFAEAGDGGAMGRLGRAYRDGKGVEKDNSLAASYFLMAASSGAPWFVCDYVIVKWEDNSSSSDSEAFAALTRYGNIDDVPTMIWLGKAYFYGRGTERNVAKAAEFFRKAYNKGSLWAGFLLFDVLWTMKNDEDAINESIEVAKNLISKGSAEGMIRLARAYREGIGVGKNLDRAIELFNNAINKGNKSAVKELKETMAENNLIQSDNLIKSIKECDVDSIISGDYDLSLLNKSMLMIDETGYDLSEFMHGLIDRICKGSVEKERIRPLVNCVNEILSKKDDDYIKQFFVSIPKATGRLREIQMLGNDMLRIFDEVCKKYDVEYSICSGTLLGAIRHNGWIPWDDDTDLLMYMEDIEKLKASLSEDDPIMIQDVNIRADGKRFKPARYYWVKYRGIKSSMYMDIFILYHIPDEMNLESIYSQYLKKVYSDMERFENKNSPQALQTVNSDYVTYFEQLMSSDEKSKRTGIITMGGKIWVFDTSDFKPFIEYKFDGCILKGMHNPYNYLSINYGNIYSVPHDLGTHEHPIFDSIDADQIRSYTEQYLKK